MQPPLRYDTDIEAAAHNRKRALHLAVDMSQAKVTDIVLAASSNTDDGADHGLAPLLFALRNDRGFAIAESLLDHDAELQATSDNGRTVLHWPLIGLELKVHGGSRLKQR